MNPRRLCQALVIAIVIAGCGSETVGPGPAENRKPTWSDAPTEAVAIKQGKGVAIPLTLSDPDGDAPAAVIDLASLPAGLTAAIDPEGGLITLHADYTLAGEASFTVRVDDVHGATTNVEVKLAIAALRWLGEQSWAEEDGPSAREHGSVIVDAERKQAFVIGGSGYAPQGTPLDDVWRFDLTTDSWSPHTPTGTPPAAGASRRVAAIPGKAEAYLFGGYGASFAVNNELHRVTFEDGTLHFEVVEQVDPPPARSLHLFTYDAGSDRFFAFGGVGSKVLGDTWTMRLEGGKAVWAQLDLATKPSPRYGFFYGVDALTGRVVLFSGAQGTQTIKAAQDTWILDMRSEPPVWQLVAEGDGVPPGRRNGCAVFDPSATRLFVFGGTANGMTTEPGLFVFDAREGQLGWAEVTREAGPPLRSSGFGLYDPIGDRTLLGFGNDAKVYRDLWALGY